MSGRGLAAGSDERCVVSSDQGGVESKTVEGDASSVAGFGDDESFGDVSGISRSSVVSRRSWMKRDSGRSGWERTVCGRRGDGACFSDVFASQRVRIAESHSAWRSDKRVFCPR